MDWSLVTCGLRGHVTYAPTEPGLRPRLTVDTPAGVAWRCLRCGTFAIGPPGGEGPADQAPLVQKGRQLRDAVVLRFFAVERALRALVVIGLAYAVWRFASSRASIERAFENELPLLRPITRQLGYDLDHSHLVGLIRQAFTARPSTLTWIALGLLAYAVVEIVEAVGLWLLKRWGEYFAVVATSFGLPIEIYEISQRVTVLRVLALVVNLVLVGYIVVTKRLFGVRGGRAAYERERHAASLLEVERVAQPGATP